MKATAVHLIAFGALVLVRAQPQTLPGIVKDRTPHPLIALKAYREIELEQLARNPELFSWEQVHVSVTCDRVEKGIGCQLLRCVADSGAEAANLLFTVTEMTQLNGIQMAGLKRRDRLELYCMVESSISTGETIVAVERIFRFGESKN